VFADKAFIRLVLYPMGLQCRCAVRHNLTQLNDVMSVTFKDNDCDDDDNDDDNEDYDNGVVTSSINLWCVGIPTTATAINRTVINIRKKNSNGTLTGIIIIIAVVVR